MQKLAAKLIEVMKDCSHVTKAGINSFHGYKYATSADVLEKVNASLTKNGIASFVVPEILSFQDVKTAKGNIEHLATVKVNITLIDTESGESTVISGIGSGQDSGDKAVMKAQTAALKYGFLMSLAVSTGDDPEADHLTDEHTNVNVVSNQQIKQSLPKQSQKPKSPANNDLICADCGSNISQKVAEYSSKKFGRCLCYNCQSAHQSVA